MIIWSHSTWTCAKCDKEAVVANDGAPFAVVRKRGIKSWTGMMLELDASLAVSVGWETERRPPQMEDESALCKPCALILVAELLGPFLKEAIMAQETT